MRVGVEPGLLHRVLALVVVTQHRPDGAEQPLVVPPHQDLEEPRLAPDDPAHDLGVGEFGRDRECGPCAQTVESFHGCLLPGFDAARPEGLQPVPLDLCV